MSWQQEWQSITESPQYHQLNDSDRESMRNDYFNERIAPNFFRYEMGEAKDIFDEYTAPQGNPDSSFLNDALQLAKSGFQSAVADIAQGATLGHRNPVADMVRQYSEASMENVSPSMLEAIENTGIDYSKEEGLSIMEDSSLKGLFGHVMQGGGSLPVSMGVGGVAGRFMGMAGSALATRAMGGANAARTAVLANNTDRARQIINAQNRAASMGNAAGFGTMGAGMMVGGVASQSYEEIMNLPDEEIRQLASFQQKVQEATERYPDNPAMAEAHAREALAKETSLANRGMSGALGFVTSVMSGPIEQRILLGRGAPTRAGNIARGMATEMGEEFSESASQQYMSNLAQIEVADREMDVMDGVIASGATGAVSGGILGGVLGGVSRPNRPETKAQINQKMDGEKIEIEAIRNKLSDSNANLSDTDRDSLELNLVGHYEKLFAYESAYNNAPTEEQLSREIKNKPDAATDDGVSQPLDGSTGKSWVSATIGQDITKAQNEYRSINGAYRRAMTGGGDAALAKMFENQLSAKQELIRSYETLRDNRENQQYFSNESEFQDWVRRLMRGGNDTRRAEIELGLRKDARTLQSETANIEQQVDRAFRVYQQRQARQQAGEQVGPLPQRQQLAIRQNRPLRERIVENRREQHITEQEQRWQELEQELEQQKNLPQIPSFEQRGREMAPDSRAGEIARGMIPGIINRQQNRRQLEPVRQARERANDDLQELTNRPLARTALSAINNNGNAQITYGRGKTLTIKDGRFDAQSMQDFIDSQRQANRQAETEQRRQTRRSARESVERSQRTRGARALNRVASNRMMRRLDGVPENDPRQGLIRSVRSALASSENRKITYGDGHTLSISNGQVRARDLKRFVDHIRNNPPETPTQRPASGRRRRQKQLTRRRREIESRTGKTGSEAIRDAVMNRHHLRGQLRSLPAALRQNWKVRSVLRAIDEKSNVTLHYGKDQHLRIRKGIYERQQLRNFVDFMQDEARDLQHKQEREAAERAARQAETPAESQASPEQTALDEWSERTGDREFAVTRATHIHTDQVTGEQVPVMYIGRPFGDTDTYMDHQGLDHGGQANKFSPIPGREWMYSDLIGRQPEKLSKGDDFLINQATHIGISGSSGTATPLIKRGNHNYVDIDGNELSFFPSGIDKINGDPEQALDAAIRKALRIQEELRENMNRKEPYPESEATHVYKPKGGKEVLIKPIDSSVAGGSGWYRRPDGTQMFLGDEQRRIKSLKEIEADKERQRKAAEKEEREAALKKARELQDIARQEADRKKRFKNDFLTLDVLNHFLGNHAINAGPEENGLTVKGKKGAWYFVDESGNRLTAEQLTSYVDEVKGQSLFKYSPPYKPEPVSLAKITNKNLQDKDLIGNGRGNPWNRKSDATVALRKKNLQGTHYVSGDTSFVLAKIPDLSGITWDYQSFTNDHGIIDTTMVPTSPVSHEQQRQIKEFTGERFTQYRKPKTDTFIHSGAAAPNRGDPVVRLRRTNREHFLKTLANTKPETPTPEPTTTPPASEPATTPTTPETPTPTPTPSGQIANIDDLKSAALNAGQRGETNNLIRLNVPEGNHYLSIDDNGQTITGRVITIGTHKAINKEGEFFYSLVDQDGNLHSVDDNDTATLLNPDDMNPEDYQVRRLTREQVYPHQVGNYRLGNASEDHGRFPVVDISNDEAARLREIGGIGPETAGTGTQPIVWFDESRRQEITDLLTQWSEEGGENAVLEGGNQPQEAATGQAPAGETTGETDESVGTDAGTRKVVNKAISEAKSYHRNLNKLADFFRSLPDSTLNHFPTLAKALKAAPVGERFRFERNSNNELTLRDRKIGRRMIPPSGITRDEYYDYLMHQISAYARSDLPLHNDTFPDIDRINESKNAAVEAVMNGIPASEAFNHIDTSLLPDSEQLRNLNKEPITETPTTNTNEIETGTGGTNETGRTGGNESLEGAPTGKVQVPSGTGPSETGGGESSGTGSGNDGAANRPRSEPSGGERDSGETVDLSGAATTSESDIGQRTGGINTGASDFTIDSKIAEDIAGGGKKSFNEKQRFENNVAAIRLIKELGDRPATAEQMEVLAKYVGWGGLQNAFADESGKVARGWTNQVKQLQDILTDDEYAAALASTPNAHYTTPPIVNAIYEANKRFGAHHGRILEPSVGTGNFIGLMPPDMRGNSNISAVELDVISGMIAQKLYPSAKINAPMGFQDFDLANGSYDMVVANPPFGSTPIHDPKRKDISGWRIHNYFLAKSMDALRPGGVMSVVVSKGWMDSTRNQQGRERMFKDAKLLGAFRLPSDAFKANANTDVTTDLLFFQKRDEPLTDEQVNNPPVTEIDFRNRASFTGADQSSMNINQYFANNPDRILGDAITSETGMYGPGKRDLVVSREGLDWQQALTDGVSNLPQRIFNPEHNVSIDLNPETGMDIHHADVGGLYLSNDGNLMRRSPDVEGEQYGMPVTGYTNGNGEYIAYKAGDINKLNQLLPMARTARELIQKQVTDVTDSELKPLRDQLNKQYDDFVRKNKALSRDANKRLLYNSDPTTAPMLLALESRYDKEISKSVAARTGQSQRKEKATKADIFTRRTQSPYSVPKSADSGQAGLVISLSQTGKVDLDMMADLTGKDHKALYKELKGQIYFDPKSGWKTKDEYLSGNVKEKLRQSREMVDNGHFDDLGGQLGTDFSENMNALEKVIPKDIAPNDITVRMGAIWQSPKVISDFWTHLLSGESKVSFVPQTNKWFFEGFSGRSDLLGKWSSEGTTPSFLMDRILNNRQIVVKRKGPDDKLHTDKKATEAANVKAEEIQTEFENWVWQEPGRRESLTRSYNDTMNTTVNRAFDGSHLAFPGKVSDDIIKFRTTQANAIWRTLQNQATLLDHVVGAGKTFTMVGSAMEMRRMGLAKKPVIVVPNHLVEQWAADFALLYPNSKVLAASKNDFTARRRKQLFARIATGDWDAVIVSHSSFGKLPSDPKVEENFLKQQIRDLTESEQIAREAEGKSARSTKELQKAKGRLQEALKKLLDNTDKDTGLTFQELGIDALFLDEAHEFKNLEFQTSLNRVKNINPSGAAKAADMYVKTQSVTERGGKLVFATGTPISNSMAEMYTMQRYLGYDALKNQGLSHFDAWAKQFGSIQTKLERKPSGKYEPESRFAQFINLPELMQQSRQFSDVINNDDIIAALAAEGKGKHIPNIQGGRPSNTVAERSLYQEGYMADIEYRFANMPDDARVDNPLKATNDARKAALDMRMIYPDLPDFAGSKINRSVDNMMRVYHEWSDDNGTQLVFCDLSTPKGKSTDKSIKDFRERLTGLTENTLLKNRIKNTDPDGLYDLLMEMAGDDRVDQVKAANLIERTNPDDINSLGARFDVYNDVKTKLMNQGVPESEIAFIHDYSTDKQKAELFDSVNTGKIRFLLGSTAKMGAGTNVQERLVALHHLDAPWRPSDLEQREGRIIRQGNQLYIRDPEGFEVEIHRYASEQTYDVNMWQTLEIKARFIEQIRNGDPLLRTAQDVGGEAASAAEMKAASSGDPRILEQVEIQRRLGTLQNLRRTHQSEQLTIGMNIERKQADLKRVKSYAKSLQGDHSLVEARPVDDKGNTLPAFKDAAGNSFKTAKEATTAFSDQINNNQAGLMDGPKAIGTFLGLEVKAEISKFGDDNVLDVWLQGKNEYPVYENYSARTEGSDNYHLTGSTARLSGAISKIDKEINTTQRSLNRIPKEINGLQEQHGQPFKYAQEYEQKKVRNQQLLEELGATDTINEAARQLPEYQQLQREYEHYESALQAATDDANRLIHQVQMSRVVRLFEKFKYSSEGTESEIAKTVDSELEQIRNQTRDLSHYAQVASRYSLTDQPAKQNYEARSLSRKLSRMVGDVARVVQRESDLPTHLKEQIASDDVSGRVKGVYDPVTDQVYVIANRVENVQDGLSTALHEAVGHKGLRNLLGDRLNTVLDGVYRSLDAEQLRQMREQYTNQLAGKPSKEQQRLLAEEHLAHLAESNPDNNFVQRAIARVRQWIRRVMPNLRYSDNDIRQLIIDAKQQAQAPTDSRTVIPDQVDSQQSALYKLDKFNQMDKEALKEAAAGNYDSLKDKIIASGALGTLGGRQITRVFGRVFKALEEGGGVNPLRQIGKLTNNMSALRGRWAHRAEQTNNNWSKLAGDQWAYQQTNDLMYDSTLAGVDPRWDSYKAKYGEIADLVAKRDKSTSDKQKNLLQQQIDEERHRRSEYDRLKQKYDLVGQRNSLAHDVFKEVSTFYNDQFEATTKALNDRVDGMALDPNATGKIKAEVAALFHRAISDGPYFPLMRHGEYVVIGKTPEGEPYREHFESKRDMKRGRQTLEQDGYTVDSTGKMGEIQASQLGGVSEFSTRIMQALQSDRLGNMDDAARAAFMDEVHQISLAMLPELSAAKRSMHRRKIAGFNRNARRAFNSVALSGSNRLSRIEYGWRIDSEINRMNEAVSERNADSPLSEDEKLTGRAVAVEMRKRHDLNMNPNGNALSAAIINGTFTMYMGASMGAGLVNMTQNFLVGLPVLAGQYGFRKSAGIMMQAMSDYVKTGKQKGEFKDLDDVISKPWLSMHNKQPSKNLSADEISLINALIEDGTIETSTAHSLADRAGSDIQPDTEVKREWLNKLVKASGMFFHNAEIFNRELIALTAMRLYKSNHKYDPNSRADREKLQEYVRDQVLDSHFDYSTYNRPRHFKSNMAKVMLIFKQYSQNMTFHLGNSFRESIDKNLTDAERKAAKKVFGTTLAMHFAFAGALGLPGMTAALFAAGLAFGDEDDPKDFEAEIRNGLADTLGVTLGHAVSKGLFDAFLNVGMHQRTKVNDLWWSDPGYEMSARQKGMHYFTNLFGGPAANYGISAMAGVSEMAQGDTMRGLQKIVPKFIRDAMRSYDYTVNGIVDSKGHVLIDDFTVLEAGMTIFGIAPARTSEVWSARNAVAGRTNAIVKRRNDLLRQLDRAYRNGDQRLFDRTVESIERFNSVHKGSETTAWAEIPRKTWRRSLRTRERNRESSVLGYQLSSPRRGMEVETRGFNF